MSPFALIGASLYLHPSVDRELITHLRRQQLFLQHSAALGSVCLPLALSALLEGNPVENPAPQGHLSSVLKRVRGPLSAHSSLFGPSILS